MIFHNKFHNVFDRNDRFQQNRIGRMRTWEWRHHQLSKGLLSDVLRNFSSKLHKRTTFSKTRNQGFMAHLIDLILPHQCTESASMYGIGLKCTESCTLRPILPQCTVQRICLNVLYIEADFASMYSSLIGSDTSHEKIN